MASSTKPQIPSAPKSATAYAQVEGRLRHKIREGEWSAGAMLPSRRDLAREYGVSSLTVDRAVTRLVAEGLLRADDRRGTFVTTPDASSAVKPQALFAGARTIDADQSARPVNTPASAATVGIVASLYVFSNDHHELHNFWLRLVLQLLEQDLSEDGKTTHFFNRVQTPNEPILSLSDSIGHALAAGVNALALVALGIETEELNEALTILRGTDIPVVCVTTGELSRPIPHVFWDSRSAGYDAASHLLRRGYTDIRYFAPFQAGWATQRREGVRSAVEHAGGSVSLRVVPERVPVWIFDEDPEITGYETAGAILDAGIAGAGVVCANDGVAVGLLRAAAERGLMAGKDFGLIGFDDRPDARTAGLTTMRPPMETMGREMARLLLKVMQGEKTDLQVRLRSHLIPRRSTHPARSEPS